MKTKTYLTKPRIAINSFARLAIIMSVPIYSYCILKIMTNNNYDLASKPRYYAEYYQLNSIPETMLLIEAECLEIPANTTTDCPQSSTQGIMWALGAIIVLIFGSTWQLYRSLDTVSNPSQVTESKELSRTILSDKQKHPSKISKSIQEIEILIQKNAIANGRF
ncbi:MAG: hypothetical protein AAF599_05410 [Bacteroidota bacterium]